MQQSNRSIAFTVSLKQFLQPIIYSVPVAFITGSLVALFYYLIDKVTQLHWRYDWLLFFLPVAGIVIHLLYKYSGKSAERGNTLIIEEIHKPGAGVPLRMTPLVLLTTLITHLFGGSAGREGTAVQMGGRSAGQVVQTNTRRHQDPANVRSGGRLRRYLWHSSGRSRFRSGDHS
jgi:H+/Cl- antiporter ClcA